MLNRCHFLKLFYQYLNKIIFISVMFAILINYMHYLSNYKVSYHKTILKFHKYFFIFNLYIIIIKFFFDYGKTFQDSQINDDKYFKLSNFFNYYMQNHSIIIIQKFIHMEPQKKNQYGFAIDIDGTLVTSYHPLKTAKQSLDYLSQRNIPYIFVTNNVAKNQQAKADQLNNILKPKVPIKGQQIILNTTPLLKHMEWEDKTILIVGRQRKLKKTLPVPEIKYYMTIEQYCTIFPQSVPLSARQSYQTAEEVQKVKEQVKKRLNLQILDKHTLKFSAILILNCPNKWQQCYQIIMDLLSSEDGSIPRDQDQYIYVKNHIPIMTALNDLYFSTQGIKLPRMLIKPFTEGLQSVYKAFYKNDLIVKKFGKPEKMTFDFSKDLLEKLYGPVQTTVIFGDNADTDILGASNAGWESVLVKTGVTKHDCELATHNVETLLQGIKKYIPQ